jgi:hypothetical protein
VARAVWHGAPVALVQVLVDGLGAVGARVVRQLVEHDEVGSVLVTGSREQRRRAVLTSCGGRARAVGDGTAVHADVGVLAGPAGTHTAAARRHLDQGRPVVSVSDDLDEVAALLDLDAEARARDLAVVVGAGFSPGLSCLLARHAARDLHEVDEVHVVSCGVGGPSCARHRRRALTGRALEWRDHTWHRRLGGVGRDRRWFPDPVGGRDCYPAALPDPLLLVPAFPGVARVTARLAASGLERAASWLRVPGRAAPEGELGALRVEVRGRRAGVPEAVVLGALDRPAVATGAVAALAALAVANGRVPAGAAGLAVLPEPEAMLHALAEVGVKAARFTGG